MTVPAVELIGVHDPLRAIEERTVDRHPCRLRHPPMMGARQHIDGKDIQPAIIVEVGHIATHRELRHVSHAARGNIVESTIAFVDVQGITGLEVIGNIDIRPAIIVDVTHRSTQPIARVVDARLSRHIGPTITTVIPEQPIGGARIHIALPPGFTVCD